MKLGKDLGLRGHGSTESHAKARNAKCSMRRSILHAIGPGQASVLDLYSGSGGMWRDVWHQATRYVGCDTQWFPLGEHPAYVADNRRLLRAIDLGGFNVADFDAHGSPWEQVVIFAARRRLAPGEVFGIVLTDGSMMRAKLGRVERNLAALAGVDVHLPGAHRQWQMLTRIALTEIARRMGGTMERMWAVEYNLPSGMLYSAAVFRGAEG